MPPKKTRATSAKSKESSVKLVSISIQTEDVEYDSKISNYQKRIELLEQELAEHKLHITELKSEIKLLKSQNNNVVTNDVVKMGLLERNTLKIKNDKIASPRSGTKNNKGCSCKGNCSNKICGCVKKGIMCQVFCRCNDAQCMNQEPEKENIEQAALSQDGQKALEKFGRLTLNQESLHASEKKAKRGMFSPFGDRTGMGNSDKPYPASPLTFETRRRLFTQDSDDVIDVNDTDNGDSKTTEIERLDSEENIKLIAKSQIQLLSQTPIAKRTRKLRIPEKSVEVEPEDNLKVSQQTEKKEIMRKEIVVQQNPAILITNISEENDDVFLPKTKKVVHSPRATRKKSKSVSPDQHVMQRKYADASGTAKVKSRSVSPEDKSSELKPGKVQHSPKPLINNLNPIKVEENIDIAKEIDSRDIDSNTQNQVEKEDRLSPHTNHNANSLSFESNISESSAGTSADTLDVSLNPMVPKHQLARSPINASGNIIALAEKKRFSPPKKELAVAEIDWDKFKSELVMCQICKRKFFPHRIDKHVLSCKGI
ncbi:uncharacterized protein LOC100679675 [Nasonia vitripennis]|uniref:C2HC/C3H-type domain-containing protein n=1 Tax=Nasonia vitripennis TaxID=7425 RepID=A0A7M7GBY8_NASVI|nr:uncharacterized protein LOC100679675 [Nasonia vitripennis]